MQSFAWPAANSSVKWASMQGEACFRNGTNLAILQKLPSTCVTLQHPEFHKFPCNCLNSCRIHFEINIARFLLYLHWKMDLIFLNSNFVWVCEIQINKLLLYFFVTWCLCQESHWAMHFDSQYSGPFSGVPARYFIPVSVQAACFLWLSTWTKVSPGTRSPQTRRASHAWCALVNF